MGESPTHKRLKRELAGAQGQVEVPVPDGQLDAARPKEGLAIQVLMSAEKENVRRAVGAINRSPYGKGLISVPDWAAPGVAEDAQKLAKKPVIIINRKGGVKARVVPGGKRR